MLNCRNLQIRFDKTQHKITAPELFALQHFQRLAKEFRVLILAEINFALRLIELELEALKTALCCLLRISAAFLELGALVFASSAPFSSPCFSPYFLRFFTE
jgi:hypothetical protein